MRHAYNAGRDRGSQRPDRTPTTRPRRHGATTAIPASGAAMPKLGYYFTGETRGYKGGRFDRTKVLHPFNEGGWGALQLNARVDYVELRDRVDGSSSLGLRRRSIVNGGKQIALSGQPDLEPDRLRPLHGPVRPYRRDRRSARDASRRPARRRRSGYSRSARPPRPTSANMASISSRVRAQVDF